MAKADGKNQLKHHLLLLHCPVNGHLFSNLDRIAFTHAKDSISSLCVEQVDLSEFTPKDEIENIMADVITITEVHLVKYHETGVATALHVSLIKCASLVSVGRALAMLHRLSLSIVNVVRSARFQSYQAFLY